MAFLGILATLLPRLGCLGSENEQVPKMQAAIPVSNFSFSRIFQERDSGERASLIIEDL